MLKEFVDKIVSLADPKTLKVGALDYSHQNLKPITPPAFPGLKLNSLASLVEYVKRNPDNLETKNLHIAVLTFEKVVLYRKANEIYGVRSAIVFSDLEEHQDKFPFGQRFSAEDFVISLQSKFVPSEQLTLLQQIASNLKSEKVKTSQDDGISQVVGQSVGVVLQRELKLPNPVSLRPFRTFREVEQPESPFVFRVHQVGEEMPKCALYEADGQAWKIEAMKNVGEYLKTNLPEIPVLF